MTNTELTKIREDRKLTKAEFAKLIGITAMLQGRYESGSSRIPDSIAEKVNALDKPAEMPAKKADRTAAKKAAPAKEKAPAKKAAAKKTTAPVLYIESLLGGFITPEEILARVPEDVDTIYVKPEKNKAYWVKGGETGSVELWD